MAFWKKKLKIDPLGGDPNAVLLAEAMSKQDVAAVRELFASVHHPDDRAYYAGICAEVPGVQDWIDGWIAAEPRSTLPLLLKGVHGVRHAWEARGAATAEHTAMEQFREFHRRLKIAEDCLDEVVERDPDDTTAWAALVTSARGRQVGAAEAQRRFQGVISRFPEHREAHEQMLQYKCGKWFGSEEEMFAFARSAPDSLAHLVAVAHIESWLGGDDGGALESEEVRAELRAAEGRAAGARRDPGWGTVDNTFAMAFGLADEWTAAKARFEMIGDRVTEWPWLYLGDAERKFEQFRKRANRLG
ncbi:hypothetical protein [Nonomuraea sp. NPDC050310]|uniref:hypothetical protein n=1 Tax=Nonomuraea sp. NPDC050310 TaxID=3154935 RepID=UPI0033D57716